MSAFVNSFGYVTQLYSDHIFLVDVLMRGVSGFWFIDSLIGDAPWNWVIEFYSGDEKVLNLLFHHVIVYNSRFSRVYVVVYRDFGGLNPYLITRLSRMMKGYVDGVLSRDALDTWI